MELWQVWTAISAVPTAWRSYVTHYHFEGHHSNTLWYNCICLLSRFVILTWTFVGRSISSDKDERSIVITCSTFVNPESSITATHSPLMNASPRIRLYFDILSNKILKKGPAQVDRSLYLICQSWLTLRQQREGQQSHPYWLSFRFALWQQQHHQLFPYDHSHMSRQSKQMNLVNRRW